MAHAFTLVAKTVQGQVDRTVSIGAFPPTVLQISLESTVFPTDPTLNFELDMWESFDGGVNWSRASGFPMRAIGGDAGRPTKGGGVSSGLPSVTFDFDGRARDLRAIATPSAGGWVDNGLGLPGPFDGGIAPYDWGLTATVR